MTERIAVAALVVQLTLGNDPGWLPVLQGLLVMCWVMQARWGGRS